MPGQLAPFARLRTLRHLDLQIIRIDQVFAGHPKATGGDLLNRRAAQIAIRIALEAARIFAAFAGVGAAANSIHRNR